MTNYMFAISKGKHIRRIPCTAINSIWGIKKAAFKHYGITL